MDKIFQDGTHIGMDVIRNNPVYEDEEASPCIEPQIKQKAQHVTSRCGNMACSWKRCLIILAVFIVTMVIIIAPIIIVLNKSSTTSVSTTSLVVIGGYQEVDGEWESLNTVDFYNMSAGNITWSRRGQPSPYNWTGAGRAVSDTDIYVIGGITYKKRVYSYQYGTYKYNIVDNTWQQLPDISWDTFNGPAVFIHHDTMYAAYEGDIMSLELSQVNGVADSWNKENITLPYRVQGNNAVVSVGDRVFIFSESAWDPSKSVISWRPGTDEPWKSVSDMNVARNPFTLCSVTDGVDRIWVMAGCKDCSQPGFIEMYRVSNDTWTQLDAVPEYTGSDSGGVSKAQICGYHDGYIYAIFNDDPRFHIFNTLDNTWSISDTELKTQAHGGQSAVVVTHG